MKAPSYLQLVAPRPVPKAAIGLPVLRPAPLLFRPGGAGFSLVEANEPAPRARSGPANLGQHAPPVTAPPPAARGVPSGGIAPRRAAPPAMTPAPRPGVSSPPPRAVANQAPAAQPHAGREARPAATLQIQPPSTRLPAAGFRAAAPPAQKSASDMNPVRLASAAPANPANAPRPLPPTSMPAAPHAVPPIAKAAIAPPDERTPAPPRPQLITKIVEHLREVPAPAPGPLPAPAVSASKVDAPPPQPPRAVARTAPPAGLHIGTLEIRVTPPPLPSPKPFQAARGPRNRAARPAGRLARGFAVFGFGQS